MLSKVCAQCGQPFHCKFDSQTDVKKFCSRSCYFAHKLANPSLYRSGGVWLKYYRPYRIWRGMLGRCHDPKNKDFPRYGARRIQVCPEWRATFKTFEQWALGNGYSDALSIHRKDGSKGYDPGNCSWATPTRQARERKSSVTLTAFGETKLVKEWVEDPRCQVPYHTLMARVFRDQIPVELAITLRSVPRGQRQTPIAHNYPTIPTSSMV